MTLKNKGVCKGPNLGLAKTTLSYHDIDFCCIVGGGRAASNPGLCLKPCAPRPTTPTVCLQNSEGFSEPILSQALHSFWVARLVPLGLLCH